MVNMVAKTMCCRHHFHTSRTRKMPNVIKGGPENGTKVAACTNSQTWPVLTLTRDLTKMDGLFEANRLVEVSMTKLSCLHKGGELPLRKTLMISKVLNKAQNIATTAHLSIIHNTSQTPTRSRASSKLLASITKKVETSSSSCFEDDRLPQPVPEASVRTTPKASGRELSPIVSRLNVSRLESGEEAMDFESVNSVLSNILSDSDSPLPEPITKQNLNKTRTSSPPPSPQRPGRFLSDLSNNSAPSLQSSLPSGGSWSAWRFDMNAEFDNTWRWSTGGGETRSEQPEDSGCNNGASLSPVKRHHQEAFPHDEKENALLADGLLYEDTKKFKSSPPEGCPLESLPGFCGYLSPINLQSAPLITYMFGKGFTEPSNPNSSDWPSSFTSQGDKKEDSKNEVSSSGEYTDDHFGAHFQAPAVKFSPILAF